MATGTAFSSFLSGEVLDHTLKNLAYSAPSGSRWIGLFTTVPNADGDMPPGIEVVGGSYARLEVEGITGRTFSVAGLTNTSDNDQDWTFVEATAVWGLIQGLGIFDALSGVNLLYHGALDSPIQVDSGEIFQFNAGDLNVTLD